MNMITKLQEVMVVVATAVEIEVVEGVVVAVVVVW